MAYEDAIVIGFGLASFGMFYLAFKFQERHTPMQILFAVLGLFMVMTNITVMQIIADNNAETAISSLMQTNYAAVLYSSIFFLFYIIVLFIWETLKKTHKVGW